MIITKTMVISEIKCLLVKTLVAMKYMTLLNSININILCKPVSVIQ